MVASGKVLRLRVRTESEDRKDKHYPPYVLLRRSSTLPLIIGDPEQIKQYLIVEAELDAWLVHQEAGEIVNTVALGSVSIRPDEITDYLLRSSSLILTAMDTDNAGGREAWGWWREHYNQTKRLPVPARYGKDPSEAFAAGLNLKTWVQIGMALKEKR